MGLKIHHLNCGSLCPRGGRMLAESGRVLSRVRLVCHCLLIESTDGLILVDCGLGLEDIKNARKRLGNPFLRLVNPVLTEENTAIRQVEKLGFKKSDVRHIVLTHLDPDHCGGMADFPEAEVHLFHAEFQASQIKRSLLEKYRYRNALWDHKPRWRIHQYEGDSWNGFRSIRLLSESIPEFLLIPLEGHSRGHCGVAVQSNSGDWLLHAGDAYFHHRELNLTGPKIPRGLAIFEKVSQHDGRARRENLERLKELANRPWTDESRLHIFCSHDPWELRKLTQSESTP